MMPVVQEQWISDPLSVVKTLFEQRLSDDGAWGIVEFFTAKLYSEQELAKIPSLNDIPLDHMINGSLVRYRCMVQDQFDPELYLKIFHCTNTKDSTKVASCGMYRDIITSLPDYEISFDDSANVHGDRHTLYCVPIPAETQWTKETFAQKGILSSSVKQTPMGFCSVGQEDHASGQLKRKLSDSGEEGSGEGMEVGGCEAETGPATKRLKEKDAEKEDPRQQQGPNLNFPLGNEEGSPCLVKVYDAPEQYKVTTVVEFVGILSISPALGHDIQAPSTSGESLDTASGGGLDPFVTETMDELRTHAPPPSLIPRLHSLVARILPHSSPTLTPSLRSTTLTPSQLEDIKSSRQMILDVLTHVFLGDKLTAEYTLLHLLSRVYGRTEVFALGKFSLNITECPGSLALTLHSTLDHLLSKCHLLPMTLENMNSLRFSPKKDYSANRLLAGVLQLSKGTNLVVDETVMVPGKLNEAGLENLAALGNVVKWQKVTYDFHFHTSDFDCDIPMLILSEGRSIINSCAAVDCTVRLSPTLSYNDQHHDSVMRFIAGLSPELLDHMRCYLALLKMAENKMNNTVQKQLEEDFVTLRRNEAKMTGEQFQYLLGVARLVSISCGSHDLLMEHWQVAREMEVERGRREN